MNHIKLNILFFILTSGFFSIPSTGQNPEASLQIDSVSVAGEEAHVVIGWTFDSHYTDGHFVIHRRTEEAYDSIATIDNLTDTFFVDTSVNANEKPYSYYISARRYKEDDTYESFASSKAHETIFLNRLEYNVCEEAINSQWNNYVITTSVGIPDTLELPFDSTIIFIYFNDEDIPTTDTVSVGLDNKIFPAIATGTYCFKLRSFDSENPTHTSTSNIKCVTSTTLEPPEFAYLRRASVVDNTHINLKLYADSRVISPAYVVHRTGDLSEDFYPVDTINSGKENISYDDEADIFRTVFYYYFEVLDSCKRSVKNSNIVSSMFLIGEPASHNENLLQWNLPYGFQGRVNYLEVKRKNEREEEFKTIAQLPATRDHYYDVFDTGEYDPSQHFIYKIAAVEALGNPYGFLDTAFSNHIVIEREVELFVPNAFKPQSTIEQNRVFKPVISNAVPKNYRLIIYNKWGEMVFQTNDHNEAWDGKTKNKKAPAGVYLYNIHFETENGKKHQKKGSVTLIR